MKILHIVPTYLPAYRYGGPIYSVHELNKWLVKNGAAVTVFTTNIDGLNDLPVKEDVIDGVRVHYFKASFPRGWFYSRDLHNALRFRIQQFDIVHVTSVFLSVSYLGAEYAKKFGKPYLISPRGSLIPELVAKKNSLLKRLYITFIEKRNLESANAIHFTTLYEKEMYGELGLLLKKAIVIPNGLEIKKELVNSNQELGKRFKKKFNIEEDAKVILSLGRLNWKKGFDTLIPAFARVVEQEPSAVLVIAGGDEDDYKKVIKSLIANYRLLITKNIIFTGELRGESKAAAYRGADVFVTPSYSENFGISAVEAMSFGIPVIVTNTVGIAPDVKEVKAGIVIEKNEEQLAKAILGLLRDEALRRELGKRGKKLVVEKYSWTEISKKWVKEYDALIN